MNSSSHEQLSHFITSLSVFIQTGCICQKYSIHILLTNKLPLLKESFCDDGSLVFEFCIFMVLQPSIIEGRGIVYNLVRPAGPVNALAQSNGTQMTFAFSDTLPDEMILVLKYTSFTSNY